MFVAVAVEDNNTRVLFERVLSSGSLPADKSRLAVVINRHLFLFSVCDSWQFGLVVTSLGTSTKVAL